MGPVCTCLNPPAADPVQLPPPHTREPFVPPPEHYLGEIGACSAFLLQCSHVFDLQPNSYATDKSCVAYIMNLLKGRAVQLGTALWEGILDSYASSWRRWGRYLITLTISGNRREEIRLLVIPSPCSAVVLELPWLWLHNPHIDWTAVSLSSWSPFCHTHCLHSAVGEPRDTRWTSASVLSLPPALLSSERSSP